MRYFITPDLQPIYNENSECYTRSEILICVSKWSYTIEQIVGYTPVATSVSIQEPAISPGK